MNSYRFESITDRMNSKYQLNNPKSVKSFPTGVLFFPTLERIFRKTKKQLAYLHKN